MLPQVLEMIELVHASYQFHISWCLPPGSLMSTEQTVELEA